MVNHAGNVREQSKHRDCYTIINLVHFNLAMCFFIALIFLVYSHSYPIFMHTLLINGLNLVFYFKNVSTIRDVISSPYPPSVHLKTLSKNTRCHGTAR